MYGLNLLIPISYLPGLGQTLEEFDGFAVGGKSHVRFLVRGSSALASAHALEFAVIVCYVDSGDLYAESLFHCRFDLRLGRGFGYDKSLAFLADTAVSLLGQNGLNNNVVCVHYLFASSIF